MVFAQVQIFIHTPVTWPETAGTILYLLSYSWPAMMCKSRQSQVQVKSKSAWLCIVTEWTFWTQMTFVYLSCCLAAATPVWFTLLKMDSPCITISNSLHFYQGHRSYLKSKSSWTCTSVLTSNWPANLWANTHSQSLWYDYDCISMKWLIESNLPLIQKCGFLWWRDSWCMSKTCIDMQINEVGRGG